ncbi:TPR repeat-containing protein (plasmid) [Tolypothrix tenuis PCC 7101]|uniref:TPR repeat-containing protein n=1 Tax=Tolypothrix tenuis PCC 7101 TaxID=231146 RepID=A0A1Z4NCB6_9CYAN|nr:tetratricopeptide repeat protein [Aulosira sp. FACHB-113]BAZ03340.1 TPR repeat-containing protein [Tolypothrix tenuis PCC 7101]BAZ78689.1 TPR repeat-containing protein [Aulosira laxa NIES-50]
MRFPNLGLSFLALVIATASTPISFNIKAAPGELRVLAQTPQARKAEAERLLQQGYQEYKTSQFEAALQSWQQALSIYREIKDRQGEGWALGNLGNAYYSLGDYPKAIEYAQQFLAIAREIKDRQGEGAALGNLGLAYYSLGDYPKAIDYHQQSLALAQEIKDRESEGIALLNLGTAYYSLGDYPKAIDYQQQSLAIARSIQDRESEGKALGSLGLAYRSLGDYPKAIEYLQKSLALARSIQDRQSEGIALGSLGTAYYFLGDYPKAIDYHQQSLAIKREIQDRRGEGNSLGGLGVAYISLGDYKQAIDYLQQSLALARSIQDRQGEGNSLLSLGAAYYSLGDYPKAIDYYQQSLAIKREIQDREGEGISLGGLGLAYHSLGDYPKAIDYQQQSLAIARSIQDRQGEGKALGNLGAAYIFLGDYKQAIDYLQQRLALARSIQDRQGEGKALGNLGLAYLSLGDNKQAINYLQQVLALARSIQDRQSEGQTLNNLGIAYYKQGNLTLAETTLIAGIKVYESLRGRDLKDNEKVSIFETQRSIYRLLQQVLIAQNKTDAALEISERGRGRAFVELLASRLSTNPKEQFPAPPNITEIKQIAKSQNATVVEYSIIYDYFKIQDKQEFKESELYIWVIKPNGEVTFRKADLKPLWQKENTTLAQLVTNSRESIGVRGRGITVTYNPNPTKVKQRFQKLHELLINPIADLLPKNPDERVTFIPQSSLFLVPFAALQDEQGKYLIEKHTILTAPAIQVLDLTHKQRQKVSGNQALVMGNPIMPSVAPKIGEAPQQLPDLPGALTEAKEIAQLLNTKAITGKDATKAAFIQRLPQARFIHLATHGLLDDFKGLGVPGAVALAPDGKDDGLLTANEILDLKINAELVVLSACDTAQGKLTGDGVIGLSRVLISAGAPSVIVTLWSIPDSPSALLMGEFYRQLQKNPDKAQALRQAMLTTMKQHPSPSNWAAFTLIGEAK